MPQCGLGSENICIGTYWLFNYGFPDIDLNTSGAQPAPTVVADSSQTGTQNQLLAAKDKPGAATDAETDSTADNNKQQFATRQAGSENAAAGTDTEQLQVAQSSTTAGTAETDGADGGTQSDAEKSSATEQSTAQSANTSTDSENSAPSATDDNADNAAQNVAATKSDDSSGSTQQQSQSATAATVSLAQRVITDPAVLKLRAHLLKAELEKPVVMDNVSFADKSDKAELNADTQVLDLAALMQQNPDIKILIRGHTAGEGSKADSKALALARATAVGQQLVEAGAAPGNIIIMGMGDAEPLSKDNNQQNRGKNRRIDVAITQ